MIVLNCEQGSQEWIDARLGIPTASQLHRVLTPKTAELSKQADDYINELVAEWALGRPAEDFDTTIFMDRGKELEPEAFAWYELEHNCDVEKVGFVLRDDRSVGCSPDGLIPNGPGLELKCPSAKQHVEYMLTGDWSKYRVQVQTGLWVCERDRWHWMSYYPELPPVLIEVPRDDIFIAKLDAAMRQFTDKLAFAKERAKALGCIPALESVSA